ncbi:hypothetical protein [Bacillus sp. ISL-34]|uniref:hypothetical protein n=1 Tax=Bacillus sp. ISL-34 TaxID=2819121 RepID=UPI002852E4CD|nr:hypothetical protein [Bacillus sp. ISL-34]
MSKTGESMFGMRLEGEMLDGNIATSLAGENALIDITPPGKMYGFHEAIHFPISLEGVGTLQIILMIEM